MNKTDMLWEIEQIKQLKARYFRLVDTRDREGFRNLFTPDLEWVCEDETGAVIKEIHGRDALVDWIEEFGPTRVSVHHGHMPEITIHDERTATGIWAMVDYVEVPGQVNFMGYGHYHEHYVKQGGDWRISKLLLTRLRVDYAKTD